MLFYTIDGTVIQLVAGQLKAASTTDSISLTLRTDVAHLVTVSFRHVYAHILCDFYRASHLRACKPSNILGLRRAALFLNQRHNEYICTQHAARLSATH